MNIDYYLSLISNNGREAIRDASEPAYHFVRRIAQYATDLFVKNKNPHPSAIVPSASINCSEDDVPTASDVRLYSRSTDDSMPCATSVSATLPFAINASRDSREPLGNRSTSLMGSSFSDPYLTPEEGGDDRASPNLPLFLGREPPSTAMRPVPGPWSAIDEEDEHTLLPKADMVVCSPQRAKPANPWDYWESYR
jgi:hypothetical protein